MLPQATGGYLQGSGPAARARPGFPASCAADGQPLAAAWVRVQTTANLTFSAADGSFTLGGLAASRPVTITAWHAGYKIGWQYITPPADDLVITLRPYDMRDNPEYAWNTSYPDPGNLTLGCGHCMAPAFGEWSDSAHAGSATNPRFLSLYNGTDLGGEDTVGPGYKQDFPGTAGNCAACHAPGRQRAPDHRHEHADRRGSGGRFLRVLPQDR